VKVKVKGDNKIDAWKAILKSAPEIISVMSEQVAEEALALVSEGFAKQTDPYGKAWPEKKVDDGRSILVGKTTRLRRGWHKVKISEAKWSIQPSVVYAAAHQDPQPRAAWGGRRLPQRMMIPMKTRGMPAAWTKRIEETLGETMAAQFASSATGNVNLGFFAYKIIGLKRRFSVSAIIRRAVREATK
jgi:hypothetical protein